MDARLDTLMEKIAADAEIAGRGISRDEASEALAEKDGHVGRALNHLRGWTYKDFSRSAFGTAASAAAEEVRKPRRHSADDALESLNGVAADSLDMLLSQHSKFSSKLKWQRAARSGLRIGARATPRSCHLSVR